jgi:hypothetical protein
MIVDMTSNIWIFRFEYFETWKQCVGWAIYSRFLERFANLNIQKLKIFLLFENDFPIFFLNKNIITLFILLDIPPIKYIAEETGVLVVIGILSQIWNTPCTEGIQGTLSSESCIFKKLNAIDGCWRHMHYQPMCGINSAWS